MKTDAQLIDQLGCYREPQLAFKNAIDTSSFRKLGHWPVEYMYMYSDVDNKIDFFKHINTRKYIQVSYE